MPIPWSAIGAIAGGLGPVVGGLLGSRGQRDANRMNLQIAREQMGFQERMSNTAYVRAARDLENAGLNRILALGKPASSPAGAAIPMQNENALLAAGLSQGMNSAAAAAKSIAETQNIQQLTKNNATRGLLLSHGETVASVAANIIRTAEAAFPDLKDPDRMAAHIKSGIAAARAQLTDALEAMGNSAKQIETSLKNIERDMFNVIWDYLGKGMQYNPAMMLYDEITKRMQRGGKNTDMPRNLSEIEGNP